MDRVAVMYVQSSAGRSGSDTCLREIVSVLDAARFTPVVVVPENGPLVEQLLKLGVQTHVVEMGTLHRRYTSARGFLRFLCLLLPSTRALLRLIRTNNVSVVHSNTSGVFAGAFAAKLARVPHVWHVREIYVHHPVLSRLIPWLVLHMSDRVVCISEAVRRFVKEDAGDRVGRRVLVIHDAIDLQPFHGDVAGSSLRDAYGIDQDQYVVGAVARIVRWKGLDCFLRSAALVLKKVPHAKFLIVGEPTPGFTDVLDELRQLVRDLDIEDHVVFAGYRPDIPTVMDSLDVLVLPSALPEPLGLVLLEAMAASRPVVATAHGGAPEIVVDGTTGLLVPPNDPMKMSDAVVTLLGDDAKRKQMGMAGRRRVEEQFALQTGGMVGQLEELYTQLGRAR